MKNDPNNNPELEKAAEIAQFRFGLIAPVIQNTYPDDSAAKYYKRITENNALRLPDGSPMQYSWKTLEKWVSEYRRFGFDGLMPEIRKDKGFSRALSDTAVERIYSLKQEHPRINATQIYQQLIQESLIDPSVNVCTVQRFVRSHDLKGARNPNSKDRKAFEEDKFGKMWQADTKYMPYITEDGISHRVYCIGILDDYSRMELKSQLFYADNAVNFQKVLKDSIEAYGVPDKLYVDNGCSYLNEQLKLICGELGIVLIHAPVRDGAAKGKRERAWRTLDERFINKLDPSQIHSLSQFNEMYQEYVRSYNTTVHGSIHCTPFERYEKTKDYIRKPKSREWLDECFLNRIKRLVHLDSTVRIDGIQYDAPMNFIRQTVEIRYVPSDMNTAFILYDGKRYPIHRTDKNANAHTKRNNLKLDYSKVGSENNGR